MTFDALFEVPWMALAARAFDSKVDAAEEAVGLEVDGFVLRALRGVEERG